MYLDTKIAVGEAYHVAGHDDTIIVASIESVFFNIEDSDIETVEIRFTDTTGKHHSVSTDWSDATQEHTVIKTLGR